MKKFLKSLLVLSIFIVSSFALVACGKTPKVERIYVDLENQTSISVTHKSGWKPEENLKVKAVLSDGSEIELSAEDCLFENFNINNVGSQEVKVSYGAYETTVTVNVEKYITGIAVTPGTVPTEVYHNDELDLSDATITVTYSDGSRDENVSQGVTHSTPVTNTVKLVNTVTFYYEGHQCTAEYEVKRKLMSIELDHNSYAKEVSWTENANAFDYSAVKVYATYSNSVSPELVSLDASNFTRKVTTNVSSENDYFTVSFGGKTVNSEDIEVYKSVSSIRYISGLESNIYYGDIYNTSNVTIEVSYNDGSKETVNNSLDASILIFDYHAFDLGLNELQITYVADRKVSDSAVSCIFEVNVQDKSLNKIEVVGKQGARSYYFLKEDKASIPTAEEVKANFKFSEDWIVNDVAITDLSLVNISVAAKVGGVAGEYVATITYKTFETKTISVYSIVDWSEANISVESISIVPGSLILNVGHNQGTNPVANLKLSVKYAGIDDPLVLDYADYDGVGETLDASDMMVVSFDNQATFSDAIVKQVAFKVTYQGQQATETINVQRTFVRIDAPSVSVLWNASGTIDFSSYDFTIVYMDGSVQVKGPTSKNGYVMDKASLASTHSYDQVCILTFNLENCYGKTQGTCEFTYNVYEELSSMTQEGALVEVEWDSSETYDNVNANSMKVYLNYTSGNKDEIYIATETTSGYKVEQNIDRTIAGKQELVLNYYTFNGTTLEKVTDEAFIVTVSVTVVDTIVNYTIENVQTTVEKDAVVDYSTLALKPIYKSGKEASVTEYVSVDDSAITSIDTSVAGVTKTLSVTYNSKTYTIEIRVVDYKVLGFTAPDFVAQYLGRNTKQNTYNTTGSSGVKGFNEINEMYVVGDDNAFEFNPIVQVKYVTNNETGTKEDVVLKATTYVYNGTNYQEEKSSDYISFDGVTHKFIFGSEAKNNIFKIVVSLDDSRYDYSTTFEFKVIDAYNVYEAKDLSVFDNKNVNGKWTAYKEANGISLDLNVKGIVLHNNITILPSDIPDIHFYKENEVSPTDPDYKYGLVGSMKDTWGEDLTYIYARQLNGNETFTFEGNFFKVDFSGMPYILRELGKVNSMQQPITSHTAMFTFWGPQKLSDSAETSEHVDVRNVEWFGNAKRTEEVAVSGGVIGMKCMYVDINIYNNISQAVYIPYFFQNTETYAKNNVMRLTKTNGYDAYNCMIYINGAKDLRIDSCHLIGAGGPIIIADHVDPKAEDGGYPTNIYVDTRLEEIGSAEKTVLESWVSGLETWFQTYDATALATSLKAVDKLMAVSNTGKSMVSSDGTKINAIAVFKSNESEGITTEAIKGTFTVDGYNKMDVSSNNAMMNQYKNTVYNEVVKNFGAGAAEVLAKMCILENYNPVGTNNAYAVPGDSGWFSNAGYNSTSFTNSADYLNMYLFNGMVAVVGLDNEVFNYSA